MFDGRNNPEHGVIDTEIEREPEEESKINAEQKESEREEKKEIERREKRDESEQGEQSEQTMGKYKKREQEVRGNT